MGDSDDSITLTVTKKEKYSPPWTNTSIIAIAGSSGSGKTSLALSIISQLNLPWVVILSMDSFYNVLTPEQSEKAFKNEFDFDSPRAIDFDILVEKLRDIKSGKKAEIPVYSFQKHARLDRVQTIYSPHVLILEGIFALHDPRVLDLIDLKIYAEADADVCLSRRLLRDVKHRGRDIEGCMKQWFSSVKPNFHMYVEPQKLAADIIVPRGIENRVAIDLICDRVRKILATKSEMHQLEFQRLAEAAEADGGKLSSNVTVLTPTFQVRGINTLLMDPLTSREEFIFYVDRLASLLVEQAVSLHQIFVAKEVETPQGRYVGLRPAGEVSAVVLLRGGAALETGLRRVIPDCRTGRLLIQTDPSTDEPTLHYTGLAEASPIPLKWPYNSNKKSKDKSENEPNEGSDGLVLLLDSQLRSGGAAIMAVRVLIDFGVPEDRIVLVAYDAPKNALRKLFAVYPDIHAVLSRFADEEEGLGQGDCSHGTGCDGQSRWLETTYFGV